MPYRTLRLTNPNMRGDDVRLVQRALRVRADGEYGPATASAVAAWKYRAGYRRPNTGLGAQGQRWLLGREPLPRTMLLLARARKAKGWRPGQGVAQLTAQQRREAAADTMAAWAARGLVELPAGSNIVPDLVSLGQRLHVAGTMPLMGYPWCAYAAFLAGLQHGGKSAKRGLVDWAFNALYCPEILSQAQQARHGMIVVGVSQARKGDLALFDFDGGVVDHVGRVLEAPSAGTVVTAEGNTSADQRGSQNNGGGVYVRHRDIRLVAAFVRDEF